MLFTTEGIIALHAWTHESLDIVFLQAQALAPPQFVQPIPGFGLASVRDQLTHILAAQSGWISRLQFYPVAPWEPSAFPDVATLLTAKRELVTQTIRYLRGLGEMELNATLEKLPPGWIGPLRSPAFILLHVCTHAFHHKGQVAAMLRILGCPLPDTDLQR